MNLICRRIKRVILVQLFVLYLRLSSGKIYLVQRNYGPFFRSSNTFDNIANVTDNKINVDPKTNIEPYQSILTKDMEAVTDGLKHLDLSDDQIAMLRKRWTASCEKKAAKICKKACVKAVTRACSSYDCRKKLKKKLKKECKIACKAQFIADNSKDSE